VSNNVIYAAEYTLIDLYEEGGMHEASDINEEGVVVGWATVNVEGSLRSYAARRNTNGTYTYLPALAESFEARAKAVNRHNVAAGYSYSASGKRAVLWTASGQIEEIGVPPGYTEAEAEDINDSGDVLVHARAPTMSRGFVWRNGMWTEIVNSSDQATVVYQLNRAGAVVGAGGSPGAYGFYWSGATGFQYLAPLPSQFDSFGRFGHAINGNEQIAGTSQSVNGCGSHDVCQNAVIWDSYSSIPHDLGNLGSTSTQPGWATAFSINQTQEVAGWGLQPLEGGGTAPRAFVGTTARGLAILPFGASTYSFAHAINGTGTVVGHMVIHNAPRGALWTRSPSNRAPTAVPGGPYSGTEGGAISFNGSGSSDPDGDALTYEWSFGDGNTSTAQNPTHTYVQDGSYTVTLTVRDGRGGSDTKTTTATISNVTPVVSAGPDATITAGQTYTLNASFSDPGADTWRCTVNWGYKGSKDTTIQNCTPGAISGSQTYTKAGTYTITVTVTETAGGSASGTSSLVLTVQAAPKGGGKKG
jgi:hypothetical protein